MFKLTLLVSKGSCYVIAAVCSLLIFSNVVFPLGNPLNIGRKMTTFPAYSSKMPKTIGINCRLIISSCLLFCQIKPYAFFLFSQEFVKVDAPFWRKFWLVLIGLANGCNMITGSLLADAFPTAAHRQKTYHILKW